MAPTRPFRVAYLMTHYPQLAQTFIAREIADIVTDIFGVLLHRISGDASAYAYSCEQRRKDQNVRSHDVALENPSWCRNSTFERAPDQTRKRSGRRATLSYCTNTYT